MILYIITICIFYFFKSIYLLNKISISTRFMCGIIRIDDGRSYPSIVIG